MSSSFFLSQGKEVLSAVSVTTSSFFFQQERDIAILLWKVFNFVGREQGKKVEIKPNSGYYLMQQERGMSQLLFQQTC